MNREAWQATYSPWGRKESDTTERLTLLLFKFSFKLKLKEKFTTWEKARKYIFSCVYLFTYPPLHGLGVFGVQGTMQATQHKTHTLTHTHTHTSKAFKEVMEILLPPGCRVGGGSGESASKVFTSQC